MDSLTNAKLADIINVEGVGYAVEDRPDRADRMEDPETARLWREAAAAIDRIYDHLDAFLRVPEDEGK